MGAAVSRATIDRAIAALEAAGHEVRGLQLRPGGDVMVLTESFVAPSVSAEPLDDELAEYRKRRGNG
jgi:hypothetical protein